MSARPKIDVKIDPKTGLVTKGGISVNSNPTILERFGGANEITSLPQGLKVINTSGTHYEIVPATPMTLPQYQNLLNLIKTK